MLDGGRRLLMSTALPDKESRRLVAEQALRESEDRLRHAASAGNIGLWDWDLVANRVYYSPEWKRQLGYAVHEISDDFEEWRRRVHPDDLERALATVKAFVEAPWPKYELELRLRHKDGSYRWVLSRGSLTHGPDGRPQRMLGVHIDITERKRSEAALRQSEERFRALAEASPDAILLHSEGQVIFANRAMCNLIGASGVDELIGLPSTFMLAPEHVEAVRSRTERLYAGLPQPRAEQVYRRLDGSKIDVEVSAAPLTIEGRPAAQVVVRDITARKRLELERAVVAQRNRALVEALGEIVYDWHPGEDHLVWEGDYAKVLGYSAAEMGSDTASWLDRVHPDDLEKVKAEVDSATRERRRYDLEYRFRHRDGSWRWMHDSGVLFVSPDGTLERIIGVFSDVTARRRNEERMRELAHRLMETEETERRKLNRELHDRIAANLSAAKLAVSLARSQLPASAGAPAWLDGLDGLLADTIRQARDIMAELSPPGLADFGLGGALRAHAERLRAQSGFEVAVDAIEIEPRPTLEVETAFFRIAQGALNNVLRHANARRAEVLIRRRDGVLSLAVNDDGCGFDPVAARARPSWGMRTMRERAEAIRAELSVDSRPGGGTRVTVILREAT